jgi:hypothetical protein
MQKVGTSSGGSDILVYEDGETRLSVAPKSTCLHLDDITKHVEKHFGPVTLVLHELASDQVHIDVLIVPPRPEQPFWVFVTSGMSDKAMTMEKELAGRNDLTHSELLVCLPEDLWSSERNVVLTDQNSHYLISWLKWLARFPHKYATWLGRGHTIPAGDPPDVIGPDTKMCGFILEPAFSRDADFNQLKTVNGTLINFLAVYPLYESEMAFKLEKGTAALFDRLKAQQTTEVFDPHRRKAA